MAHPPFSGILSGIKRLFDQAPWSVVISLKYTFRPQLAEANIPTTKTAIPIKRYWEIHNLV